MITQFVASDSSTPFLVVLGTVVSFFTFARLILGDWKKYRDSKTARIEVEYLKHDDPHETVLNEDITVERYGPSPKLIVFLQNAGPIPVFVDRVAVRFPPSPLQKHYAAIPVFVFQQRSGSSPTIAPREGQYYSCEITPDLIGCMNGKRAPYIADDALMEFEVKGAGRVLYRVTGERTMSGKTIVSLMFMDIGLANTGGRIAPT